MNLAPGIQYRPVENQAAQFYKTIFVPVDNSPYSNRAVESAVLLGRSFASNLTGCHVYAARMHDYRFKQMEYTLPEEYLEEQELERQRKIHDSLITMGLELISDCYLEDMDRKCQEAGLTCNRKMMDGKHSTELIRDIQASGYDLVVMGALGIGRVRDSQIGSVCERVARNCRTDLWVVKHVPREGEKERDTILVGVDGSPLSFGALMTGAELARRFNKKLELIAVYDPYLHYAVFKGIVDVLTEKASKVFRFEEQNQLHEEIIDTGLAQIYQSHLNVAEAMVEEAGVPVTTTLLDGKAFQKILDRARKLEPWVLIVGRIGIHSPEDESGLGSNSENLLRLAPCDVLLTTRLEYPELDLKAEEAIHWTPEAEGRMERVPSMVRNIARTAILRLAVEKGHSVITNALVTEAMERFMPRDTARTTTRLAESLALERARRQPVSICKKCGVTAKTPDPVRCSVCGSQEFQVVSPEVIERIAGLEGGVEEETTYDGRKVKWTQEARRALYAIQDKYQMRRCKARIEKKARMNRVGTITLEFARGVIGEETGRPFLPVEGAGGPEEESGVRSQESGDGGQGSGVGSQETEAQAAGHTAQQAVTETAPEPAPEGVEVRMVARDLKGTPLHSHFSWTEAALERVFRVPAGFMRNRTQQRIEELARERAADTIDLDLVEEGIEFGRRMMAEMIAQYAQPETPVAEGAPAEGTGEGRAAASDDEPEDGCPVEPQALRNTASTEGPVSSKAGANGGSERGRPEEPQAADTARAEGNGKGAPGGTSSVLNETGWMSDMARRRNRLLE